LTFGLKNFWDSPWRAGRVSSRVPRGHTAAWVAMDGSSLVTRHFDVWVAGEIRLDILEQSPTNLDNTKVNHYPGSACLCGVIHLDPARPSDPRYSVSGTRAHQVPGVGSQVSSTRSLGPGARYRIPNGRPRPYRIPSACSENAHVGFAFCIGSLKKPPVLRDSSLHHLQLSPDCRKIAPLPRQTLKKEFFLPCLSGPIHWSR
jgi:hypothetical protein